MPADSDPKPGSRGNLWVQAARYTQLALVFPAAVVVGWLGGTALDHWLHTTWIALVGMFLGIAAGFIELIRAFLRDAK
jgi:ATP synthase protein I